MQNDFDRDVYIRSSLYPPTKKDYQNNYKKALVLDNIVIERDIATQRPGEESEENWYGDVPFIANITKCDVLVFGDCDAEIKYNIDGQRLMTQEKYESLEYLMVGDQVKVLIDNIPEEYNNMFRESFEQIFSEDDYCEIVSITFKNGVITGIDVIHPKYKSLRWTFKPHQVKKKRKVKPKSELEYGDKIITDTDKEAMILYSHNHKNAACKEYYVEILADDYSQKGNTELIYEDEIKTVLSQ